MRHFLRHPPDCRVHHDWFDELAGIEGISDRYVSSLLPLAFLAPDIVGAIAAGRQPASLTAHRLIRTIELPISWGAQKQLLGFS